MFGIRIKDLDVNEQILDFDLRDILQTIGHAALESRWRMRDVEASAGHTMEAADELQRLSDEKADVLGRELIHLARHVDQVVEGHFRGTEKGAQQPWIVINAVDSTFFEVITPREEVVTKLRNRFKDITDMTDEELTQSEELFQSA